MRIAESIWAKSLCVILEINHNLMERAIFRFLQHHNKGKLSENYKPYDLEHLGAYLLETYVEQILMPDELSDFINCINQLEIL